MQFWKKTALMSQDVLCCNKKQSTYVTVRSLPQFHVTQKVVYTGNFIFNLCQYNSLQGTYYNYCTNFKYNTH